MSYIRMMRQFHTSSTLHMLHCGFTPVLNSHGHNTSYTTKYSHPPVMNEPGKRYLQPWNSDSPMETCVSSLSLLVHTSSSSFTLHLPLSRRDWTSCNLPAAAATSRSSSSEALAAACACDDRSRTHSRRDGGSYQPFTAYNIQSWFRGECTCKAEEMVRPGMHRVIIFLYTSNPQSIYLCTYILRNKATYASTHLRRVNP